MSPVHVVPDQTGGLTGPTEGGEEGGQEVSSLSVVPGDGGGRVTCQHGSVESSAFQRIPRFEKNLKVFWNI